RGEWRRSGAYAGRARRVKRAKNPANASRSGSVNTGSTAMTAGDVGGDVVAMGTSRVGLRPGKAGPAVAPATMLRFTGKRAPAITQGHHAIPTVAPCRV